MTTLRLGLQVRDFDLDRVGFELHVLGRDRHDGSGGYLRMTLVELSRLVAALRQAEHIDLVAIEPEWETSSLQAQEDEEEEVEYSAPESGRTADVIAFPWLSKVWRGAANARQGTPAGAELAAGSVDAGTANEEEPKKIRVTRGELRQPVLF
jgi:hypothetical protein